MNILQTKAIVRSFPVLNSTWIRACSNKVLSSYLMGHPVRGDINNLDTDKKKQMFAVYEKAQQTLGENANLQLKSTFYSSCTLSKKQEIIKESFETAKKELLFTYQAITDVIAEKSGAEMKTMQAIDHLIKDLSDISKNFELNIKKE